MLYESSFTIILSSSRALHLHARIFIDPTHASVTPEALELLVYIGLKSDSAKIKKFLRFTYRQKYHCRSTESQR